VPVPVPRDPDAAMSELLTFIAAVVLCVVIGYGSDEITVKRGFMTFKGQIYLVTPAKAVPSP